LCGDLLFEPGSRYRYSNSGFYLLKEIIERVTGKTLEENLHERILSPLGLEDSGLIQKRRINPRMASICFIATNGISTGWIQKS